MTTHYQDGATQRTIAAIYYQDGATQRTIQEVWIGHGGTKQQVFAASGGSTVNANDHTVEGFRSTESNPFPPPATFKIDAQAGFTIKADGTFYWYSTPTDFGDTATFDSGTYAGEWLISGAAADIEVRVSQTASSGTSTETGASRNTWLSCGSDRTFGVIVGYTAAPASRTYFVEFRRASDGVVVDSCTVVLQGST